MTGPQVPEGLAERLDQMCSEMERDIDRDVWRPAVHVMRLERRRDALDRAAAIVRFWERVAPFLDDDTIRLATAAADVAGVLPDGWNAPAVSREPWSLTYQEARIGVDRMWFDLYFELDDVVEWTAHRAGVNEEGFADTPADAARAALAALSGDPTDG